MNLDLDGLIKRTWAIDCPTMSLISARAGIEGYQGTGCIELAEDHQLRFKLISTQKTLVPYWPESTQTGQLYAPEEYWRLVSRDVSGREWTSEQVLPDVLHGEGTVVTGYLRNLSSSEPNDPGEEPHSIKLWLLGDFKVTCNQLKMTTTTIGGEALGPTGEWSHGKFSLGQRDFLFRKEPDWFFLEAQDHVHSFHPFYSDRIEEALELVLGRPAHATVLSRSEHGLISTEIRSVAPAPHDPHAKPPYPPPIKHKEGHFWNLFGLILNYIEGHNSRTRSPLSRAWQYFIDSRNSKLELRALALGAGIEALLKVYCPLKKAEACPQVETARNVIGSAELEESIKRRLLGALNNMTQMSPSDVLRELVEGGIISGDQFRAWKQIRHRAAHAGDFTLDDATLGDCNRALTAAHRILFDLIGYRGAYGDYGTPAWPELVYPERSSV